MSRWTHLIFFVSSRLRRLFQSVKKSNLTLASFFLVVVNSLLVNKNSFNSVLMSCVCLLIIPRLGEREVIWLICCSPENFFAQSSQNGRRCRCCFTSFQHFIND